MMMASPVSDYLDRYAAFIVRFEKVDNSNADPCQLDSLKREYKALTKELSKHKKNMTTDDLECYYTLKGRYQKKMTIIKTRRNASAFKGWVKGVTGK